MFYFISTSVLIYYFFIFITKSSSCPFSAKLERKLAETSSYPAVCNKASISRGNLTCETLKLINTSYYNALPEDIINRTNLIALSIRVAFHDAAEFDLQSSDEMGPDGCLSSDSDNAGLIEDTSLIMTTLENIWQNYCDQISRADFWVYIATIAIRLSSGYKITVPYQFGREDSTNCSLGNGRLPSGQFFLNETENFFLSQLNLNNEDAITLLGAHTVGHVHPNVSGYGQKCSNASNNNCNAWDGTPSVFDNNYYVNLINALWGNKAGVTSGNIWTAGPNILMNTDMTLGFTMSEVNGSYGVIGQQCGGVFKSGLPTAENGYDCKNPAGVAESSGFDLVKEYASDNDLFLQKFSNSFVKLTTVGYNYNKNQFVKFGDLYDLDCVF